MRSGRSTAVATGLAQAATGDSLTVVAKSWQAHIESLLHRLQNSILRRN